MAKKELKTVRVQATNSDKKVAFYEKDERHPGGQAFVYGNGAIHEVVETTGVKKAIGEGFLTKDVDESRVPPLREATESEEDAAGLETDTEKETAKVPVSEGGIRRGGRPN